MFWSCILRQHGLKVKTKKKVAVLLYENDNQGKSQSNHDIEGPDDNNMDLNRARQLFNSEKIQKKFNLSIVFQSCGH